jgi:plasmid stabilization system protein ParE
VARSDGVAASSLVNLILRPPAKADLLIAIESLAAVSNRVKNRFMLRLDELFERVESMPEMYGIVWRNVRAAKVKRFKHVVFYVVLQNHVEVIAIVHGSRHDSAWKSRI